MFQSARRTEFYGLFVEIVTCSICHQLTLNRSMWTVSCYVNHVTVSKYESKIMILMHGQTEVKYCTVSE